MRLSNIITDLHEQANPSDEGFWEIVKNARWTSDHNYDRIKYQWMRTMTLPQVEGLQRKFQKFAAKLDNKITDVVHGVSDDGLSDLVAHIIGMGKQSYNAVMKDPHLAQRLIDNHNYVESFAYAFPYKDDYDLIDPQHLIKQATGYLEELSELTSTITSQVDAETLRNMIKRLRAAESGDFKKATRGWDKAQYLMNDLNDFLKR